MQVHTKLGSRVLLDLGEMNWTVSVSDPDIINPVIGVTLIRGAQALYSADRLGVTTISAEGRPICNTGEVCAQYIVEFYATVVVEQ